MDNQSPLKTSVRITNLMDVYIGSFQSLVLVKHQDSK